MLENCKDKRKVFLKNLLILILIIVSHVLVIFTSPAFLGVNYSKKLLIDDYCKNNLNGGSFIFKADVSYSEENANKIIDFKQSNDTDLNTVLGLTIKESTIENQKCTIVGSKIYEPNNSYNNYRLYSNTGWDNLKKSNYIYIPDSLVPVFVPEGANVKDYMHGELIDTEVVLTACGISYTFRIGGIYSTEVVNGGWRSRGKYFTDTFQNCIFVNQAFIFDKFDGVFEMFTSETSESSLTYNRFENLVHEISGETGAFKNISEAKLYNDLSKLKNQKRNKVLQIFIILITIILLILSLGFIIYLFKATKLWKFGVTQFSFILCAFYLLISYLIVFLTKDVLIKTFGFFAYGANKASLNIISIYLFLFFVSACLKTYSKIKNDKMTEAITNKALESAKPQNKGQIIFISKAKFPDTNAFATYIGGLASVYKNNGYDVICLGGGYSEYKIGIDTYFGKYFSFRKHNKNTFVSKVLNYLFLEDRIFKFLKKNFMNPKQILFSCEFSSTFYDQVKRLYEDTPVNYSFIVTEEYTKDEFEKYNYLSRKSLHSNRYFVNKYRSKKDSFIVISRYLQSKISNRGMDCVYIPFSFNKIYIEQNIKPRKKHEGINYIYCGSPENKDLLPIIVEAFSSLGDFGINNKIHFDIIGADKEWAYKHNITSFDETLITFHGRKDKQFVFDAFAKSDYSLLLRDENKVFAKAGFPTKISESMMLGVTPITNLTSNLSDYLNDNNSIIIKGETVSSVIDAIKFSIDDFKGNELRRAHAIETAKENFNIDVYKEELLSLINKTSS